MGSNEKKKSMSVPNDPQLQGGGGLHKVAKVYVLGKVLRVTEVLLFIAL